MMSQENLKSLSALFLHFCLFIFAHIVEAEVENLDVWQINQSEGNLGLNLIMGKVEISYVDDFGDAQAPFITDLV